MAFTNILPGSSLYPDLLLEWAPTTQPTESAQAWEDITDLLRGWSWGYGRNDELGTFEAGTGSVVLDNRDRLFDPSFDDGDATNLVTNGGFETNTTGWAVTGSSSHARSLVQSKYGVASVLVTAAADAGGIYQPAMTPLTPSTAYTFSAWVYSAAGGSVRIYWDEYTAGLAYTGTSPSATAVVPAGLWTRVSLTATTTGTTANAQAILTASGAAHTFYADGIQFELGSTATRYIETDGGTASRLAANIKPRRMFRLTAKWDGVEYPMFVAYARGYPQTYPGATDATVNVDLVDAFAVLQGVDLVAGFTRPAELAGTRIEAVLDAIGIPAAQQDIAAGSFTMAAIDVTDSGTSGLAHAKDIARDDGGTFYVGDDGVLTFADRYARLNQDSLYSFTDAAGATYTYGLDYSPDFDDTYIWNYVHVSGPDAEDTPGVATDTASGEDYYPLVRTISSKIETFNDRQSLAERELALYKQPALRLPRMSLAGARNPDDMWPILLDIKVPDRITVTHHADTSDPTVMVQNVEGVFHGAQPGGPWVTTIATSPADTNEYWELEIAGHSELEETTQVGF